MYNKEKDEAVVLTVALNKCLKEREKNTMENEKTSLNIKKLKKQVKRNYTYIARSHDHCFANTSRSSNKFNSRR